MSLADDLHKLEALRSSGALSEHEYALAKARVLDGSTAPSGPRDAAGTNPLQTLRRSNTDYWFGGVCGGLGERTPVPSWGWRLGFCLATLYFGAGLVPYILLWIFVPSEDVLG